MNRKIKLLGVVAALLTQCLALHALTEKDIATLNVAYFYNFKFYDKAVEKGSLENLGTDPLEPLILLAIAGSVPKVSVPKVSGSL